MLRRTFSKPFYLYTDRALSSLSYVSRWHYYVTTTVVGVTLLTRYHGRHTTLWLHAKPRRQVALPLWCHMASQCNDTSADTLTWHCKVTWLSDVIWYRDVTWPYVTWHPGGQRRIKAVHCELRDIPKKQTVLLLLCVTLSALLRGRNPLESTTLKKTTKHMGLTMNCVDGRTLNSAGEWTVISVGEYKMQYSFLA